MIKYYTHQKYLKRELDNLKDGSLILELGIGHGSCPLMYEYCKKNPNSIVTGFETDAEWFTNMHNEYGDLANYNINSINTWEDLKNYINKDKYDLIFADQAPWEARIESIDFLKDRCDLFILHDYDYFNKPQHSWVSKGPNSIYINDDSSWLGQKYGEEFVLEDNYKLLPPTLVMRKKQ